VTRVQFQVKAGFIAQFSSALLFQAVWQLSAKALLCEEQLAMINFIPSKSTLNAALLHEYIMKTGKTRK
jgi:hypothetical protein